MLSVVRAFGRKTVPKLHVKEMSESYFCRFYNINEMSEAMHFFVVLQRQELKWDYSPVNDTKTWSDIIFSFFYRLAFLVSHTESAMLTNDTNEAYNSVSAIKFQLLDQMKTGLAGFRLRQLHNALAHQKPT